VHTATQGLLPLKAQISAISGPVTAAVPNGSWVRFEYDYDNNLSEVT